MLRADRASHFATPAPAGYVLNRQTGFHAPLLSSLVAQTHARQTRSCVPHSRGHRPLLWLSHASHRKLRFCPPTADGFCPHSPDSYHHAPMCCGSRPRNHTVAFRVKTVSSLEPAQFPLRDRPRLCRHRIPQAVGAIVAADAFLVRVHLEHVLWA